MSVWAAAPPAAAQQTFRKYCLTCHGKAAMAGVNLEKLLAAPSVGEHFQQWEKVLHALEDKQMPPAKMPQPDAGQRAEAARWVRTALDAYAKKHAGDPGRVTLRRLTNAEYAYAVRDLTGLDLRVAQDFESDSVGGEGFASYGDVQFVADANLERYLEAAKRVAEHAVIGAGPLTFFADPGKSGFELSAIARIQEIYRAYGFRTVSGEGGQPYGLERYGKALYVAWRYRHRAARGEAGATLAELAKKEAIPARFAEHIWTVMNRADLGHPSAEAAARWKALGAVEEAKARAACAEIQKYITTWPSFLFARGDVAAGGAGDERPLDFGDDAIAAKPVQTLRMVTGLRAAMQKQAAPKVAKVYLHVVALNPSVAAKPRVMWKNAGASMRTRGMAPQDSASRRGPAAPRVPLRQLITPETARRLRMNEAGEFVAEGTVGFEVPLTEGATGIDFQVEAVLEGDRNHVLRLTLSEREDGATRGVPIWALLGDPVTAGYQAFKKGVQEFARILPPNSHSEPTPADKDPLPPPFDTLAYNTPARDAFIVKVKYRRDDRFVVENLLDPPVRRQLDEAWSDLLASFEYHDAFVGQLSDWYKLGLTGKRVRDLQAAQIAALPAEPRGYIAALRREYDEVQRQQAAGEKGHVEDVLKFASRAWRRPLTVAEQAGLRAFFGKARTELKLEHDDAVKAMIARVLVAPAFLYRSEPVLSNLPRALTSWEMASRLSFFLWSSVPDDELRRAAAAGELLTAAGVQRQVKRMLADAKARRLAEQFFGQWLGFWGFEEYRGVDTTRYPEFTAQVRAAMYDEAVSFFEHIIREDRPVRELLHADYAFLNKTLGEYYRLPKELGLKEETMKVEGAGRYQRGGLLRLGSVLTATSAPLRTSPVKRGDWVLRRIIGTPVPPPPADAGSLPADEKNFGGLSLKEKLESHKRNATCAGCHTRIDPLGFPLEKYDSTGRWRERYHDGKPIDVTATLKDQRSIDGVEGLLAYLREMEPQVLKTMSRKLVGFALGRTVLLSDQPLVDKMMTGAGEARFSQLVAEIAASPQFRQRKATPVTNEPAPKKAGAVEAGLP